MLLEANLLVRAPALPQTRCFRLCTRLLYIPISRGLCLELTWGPTVHGLDHQIPTNRWASRRRFRGYKLFIIIDSTSINLYNIFYLYITRFTIDRPATFPLRCDLLTRSLCVKVGVGQKNKKHKYNESRGLCLRHSKL